MRKLFPTLFLCLLFCFASQAQTDDWVVQLAAFDRQVPVSYFKGGLSGIYHVKDHNDIHKYYIGGFTSEAAANEVAKQAQANGYNARAIDMGRIRNACALGCGMAPMPDPTKIRSIFFDFDKSALRSESRYQLDQLYTILTQNPEYNLELSAHTDAKGSLEYNKALSIRRANAAKEYLTNKGIPAARIKVSTFGEEAPIAKNELDNGQDTEQGRQYNRRVELIVFNPSGTVEPVVEKIEVPDALKQ